MGYSAERADAARRLGFASRVLVGVLVLNLVVAAAKMIYGASSGAVSMVADGFHSLFDGASNVVGLVGLWVARRPADRTHPYGHGKYETWASVAIGGLLAVAAWSVGKSALIRLMSGGQAARVDAGSFVVMGVTLAINVGVTLYERRAGQRLNSEVLLADASHTASDVLVSMSVVAGLVAVRMGLAFADPLIALGVSGMILRAAWLVFRRAERTFSDRARIPEQDVCDLVCAIPGVLGCHDVRTRGSLSEVYVDLHVQVDPSLSLMRAHEVAESVERAIVAGFPGVMDAIVHVEPMDMYQADKTAEQMQRLGLDDGHSTDPAEDAV